MSLDDENANYKVLVNAEGQYCIAFSIEKNPAGWRHTGKSGTKQECLSYIGEVWTDLTPLSLRTHNSVP